MWWKTGVIYQVYPRSFMDSNGDGIGDLAGVLSRLDYLNLLGIDAIWFSPIFASPMVDFGYDVADYTRIHPDYGTLDTFDKLLVEAHSRDIKVLLDLVPNHTSIEHEWFKESRSSRDNPKRDWYIWKDARPDGSPPNNWISYFGGPAWTFDAHTGQYYMHNFDPLQPELNWRNPEVVQAVFDAIRFWLRRGVDGFRIDVIDRVLKDEQFRDNPMREVVGSAMRSQERIYSEGAPGTQAMMKRFRAVFDEFPGTVAIGELAYWYTPEEFSAFYGAPVDAHNGDGLHLPFNFGLLERDWNAEAIRAYVDEYDASVPSYGWPNYVLGNHDVPRIASKYGAAQSRVAALMLLTLRGTPTIYYGEELGMTNVTIPEDRVLDPQGRNKAGFNRDECRTPMQWDDSPQAGFSASADTWLPLAADYAQVNVAAQQADPDSMLNFYQRVLAYRRQTPALNEGRYYSIPTPGDIFAYYRQFNDQRYLIVLNFTATPHDVNLPEAITGEIAISTYRAREGELVTGTAFTLGADEGVVIRLEAV